MAKSKKQPKKETKKVISRSEILEMSVTRREMGQFTGSMNNFDIEAMADLIQGKNPDLYAAWLSGCEVNVSILPAPEGTPAEEQIVSIATLQTILIEHREGEGVTYKQPKK